MSIDWGSFVVVFVVSFGSAVAVVVLLTLALVGFSARVAASRPDSRPAPFSPSAGTAVGAICVTAAAAIVLYGLWVIVAK